MARHAAINPFSTVLIGTCGILAACGAVPTVDIVFSLTWPAYIAAINKLRFDSNRSKAASCSPSLVADAWVAHYAKFGGLIALLIPATICIASAVGQQNDPQVLNILGPHLYLLAAQVVCEFFTSSNKVAMLPRMLVPIGFNTYRMWSLVIWCKAAIAAGLGPWHVVLAVGNLLFWAFNLFVFLLLKMLPLYLDPEKAAV